jgi:gamma-carbonic anhydrase
MIYPHHKKWPEIHETAFIAPSADVIGEVKIGADSSIWFQCVVRGDVNPISIGRRTNIQDHSMLHVDRRDYPLVIGDEVTVGHRVMLHGCTIGDRCLIGMGAIIMNKAVVGEDCIIGAGALITENMVIPPRSLVLGRPGKVVRELKESELAYLKKSAENYVGDSREYRAIIPSTQRFGVNDSELSELDDFKKTAKNFSRSDDEGDY